MKPFKSLLPLAIVMPVLWHLATKNGRQQRKLCRQADVALAFVTQNPGIHILTPGYISAFELAIDWLKKVRPQLPAEYDNRIQAAFQKAADMKAG